MVKESTILKEHAKIETAVVRKGGMQNYEMQKGFSFLCFFIFNFLFASFSSFCYLALCGEYFAFLVCYFCFFFYNYGEYRVLLYIQERNKNKQETKKRPKRTKELSKK